MRNTAIAEAIVVPGHMISTGMDESEYKGQKCGCKRSVNFDEVFVSGAETVEICATWE